MRHDRCRYERLRFRIHTATPKQLTDQAAHSSAMNKYEKPKNEVKYKKKAATRQERKKTVVTNWTACDWFLYVWAYARSVVTIPSPEQSNVDFIGIRHISLYNYEEYNILVGTRVFDLHMAQIHLHNGKSEALLHMHCAVGITQNNTRELHLYYIHIGCCCFFFHSCLQSITLS